MIPTFADLERARARYGHTVTEASAALEISDPYYRGWLAGKPWRPSIAVLERIEKYIVAAPRRAK